MTFSYWTPDMDADLLRMNGEGKTYGEIADFLCSKYELPVTRCSAIGRAYRLKKHGVKILSVKHKSHIVKLAEQRAIVRRPDFCQWPSGDGPYTFECNNPVMPNRPYCACHCDRAYVPRKISFDHSLKNSVEI